MAKITRTAAIKVMEAVKITTAGALSTPRLQKKLNRIDRLQGINIRGMTEEQRDLLDFVLAAIKAGATVEVQEDRKNVPQPAPKPLSTRKEKPLRDPKDKRFNSGRQEKYDWNTIFNGSINSLTKGEDFDCKITAFAMQVRSAAKRRQIDVKVSQRGNTVIVQATKDPIGRNVGPLPF